MFKGKWEKKIANELRQVSVGDSTAWDDLQVPVTAVRLGGASPADEAVYKDGVVLSFDNVLDEYVYFNAQLPHTYKEGTDIEFHLHATPKTSGAGGGAENVKFDLTYSWASIGGTFPSSSSLTVTRDVQNDSADDHILFDVGDIAGDGKGISSMLICSLKRDVSVGSNYADEFYVVGLDFHFEVDSFGSREEASK